MSWRPNRSPPAPTSPAELAGGVAEHEGGVAELEGGEEMEGGGGRFKSTRGLAEAGRDCPSVPFPTGGIEHPEKEVY